MKDAEIGQEVWLLFLDLIAAQRRDDSSPETVALTMKWMEITKRIDEMAILVNDMSPREDAQVPPRATPPKGKPKLWVFE